MQAKLCKLRHAVPLEVCCVNSRCRNGCVHLSTLEHLRIVTYCRGDVPDIGCNSSQVVETGDMLRKLFLFLEFVLLIRC